MKKRGIFIGVGTAMVIVGLAGLGLVQTGALFQAEPSKNVLQLPLPTPEATQQSGQQVEPQQPQPGPDSAQTPGEQSQQPPSAAAPQQKDQGPVPLPNVGTGNRSYPKPQVAPFEKGTTERKNAIEPPPGPAPNRQAQKAAPRVTKERRHRSETERGGPLVIKLRVDPERQRDEIRLARVHFGDRVVVKVRRERGADRQVYLTFGLPDLTERVGPNRRYVTPQAVLTPVLDKDEVVLSSARDFGTSLTRRLSSRDGAVLKLGTRSTHVSYSDASYGGRGGYEIEIRIYSENRWNIKPRSYQ
ncbi:MAG: hypothetical protein LLG06_00110 [Desulfobacteraceae bacterium]|nr:hypothetical protein [Desulfobacteraceae bacterium]